MNWIDAIHPADSLVNP